MRGTQADFSSNGEVEGTRGFTGIDCIDRMIVACLIVLLRRGNRRVLIRSSTAKNLGRAASLLAS